MAITSTNGAALGDYCFGTMQFGDAADAAASAEMYAACRGAGMTFFDTAYVYNGGESERILGTLIASERDDVIVATKVAQDRPSTIATIHDSLDESLRRMNTDYTDILYMHRFDDSTPLEETFDGLAEVRQSGKARYIGVSNFAAWQTMKAQNLAIERGFRVAISQPMYNLVKRQAEVEILPMAASEGVAIAPYSPLGGGLLTGKYAGGGSGRLTDNAMYNARYNVDWMYETATALKALGDREGVHPATLAVAWVARNPAVTTPIISAKSLSQLAPSLAAMSLTLTDSLYDEITALSQTPPPATDRLEEA